MAGPQVPDVRGAMVTESRNITSSAGMGKDAGPWTRHAYAACLVLFPLLWGVFAGTDIHPSPSGETAAEQVRAVAGSADAWRQVHIVLAGASLLGIGAVLGLRSLVPRSGRLSAVASIFAALGVAAAGLVAGIVATEATLVAPVAEACAGSSSCLAEANEPFLTEFAEASWNDLTTLSYATGTLIFSLGALGVLGWLAKSVRVWEAAVMIVGIVGIYATNTILHGDAKYGLLFVLLASGSIAFTIERRRSHG